MRKTKAEIIRETRELVKDFRFLAEKAEREWKEGNDPCKHGEALGRLVAYELAANWLEEIVGKNKEGGG